MHPAMADSDDPVVLSFHDSCLRRSDVNLLEGTNWLNDRVIGFAFEYFEKKQFSAYTSDVSYVSPDVSQFIKLAAAEEVGIFLEPLQLDTKQFVFLAVNDNADESSVGGSHWSLLMYRRSANQFEHYDSFGGNNAIAARGVANKIKPYLRCSTSLKYVEQNTPQQTNSCDCGVYVISICEHLNKQAFCSDDKSLSNKITPSYVTQKRTILKDLILSISSE